MLSICYAKLLSKVSHHIYAIAELSTNYLEFQTRLMRTMHKPVAVSESIASSAVSCARQVDAAVIVCFTELGGTARLVAKVCSLI
jgi:pyruvate kinase